MTSVDTDDDATTTMEATATWTRTNDIQRTVHFVPFNKSIKRATRTSGGRVNILLDTTSVQLFGTLFTVQIT